MRKTRQIEEEGKLTGDIKALLHREWNFWVNKPAIVRRALRLYLEHLKKFQGDTEEELIELLKGLDIMTEVDLTCPRIPSQA